MDLYDQRNVTLLLNMHAGPQPSIYPLQFLPYKAEFRAHVTMIVQLCLPAVHSNVWHTPMAFSVAKHLRWHATARK
jgi:hypothetical protein